MSNEVKSSDVKIHVFISRIENKDDRHCPKKSWGWEEWIVNNELYCGKRLHFTVADGSTSMHFHVRKHETMYVERGVFDIAILDTTVGERVHHVLGPGDSIVIPPNTPHAIRAHGLVDGEAILVEFSTHHEDSDSYRVSKR